MIQNEFIKKEVEKIVADKNLEYPKNIALAATWIMAHFKGINLKVLDVRESSSLADYYLMASASNTMQARAMTDEIQTSLRQAGSEIISIEGLLEGEWVLIDAGDIIIHIFNETSRDIFDLDTLWAKHPQVEIPQDYYFASHSDSEKTETGNTENYF